MQRGLVDNRSDKHGRAIFLTLYSQAPKLLIPSVVEVPSHLILVGVYYKAPAPLSVIFIGIIYRRWMPIESAEGCSRGCNLRGVVGYVEGES